MNTHSLAAAAYGLMKRIQEQTRTRTAFVFVQTEIDRKAIGRRAASNWLMRVTTKAFQTGRTMITERVVRTVRTLAHTNLAAQIN